MKRSNPFSNIYKICNNGKNEEKYQLILDGKLRKPRYIDIELTNYCNMNCRMCPTGTNSIGVSRGFMSSEVVDAIFENVKQYSISGVRCIGWGEPTIHSDFWNIVKRIKETGSLIHFNTNGKALHQSDLKRIVDLEVESVKFSFQGTDADSYHKMRTGGDWAHIFSLLTELNSIRGEKEFPYIQVTTTITNETTEQVNGFEKIIEGVCDYYNIGRTELSHLDIDKMDISEKVKEEIRRLKETETIEKRHFYPCPDAFDHFQVMWNGNVSLCCNDYGNGMIIGNVLKNDFEQIFTGEKANSFRRDIIEKGYDGMPLCSKCYEWAPRTR